MQHVNVLHLYIIIAIVAIISTSITLHNSKFFLVVEIIKF